MKACNSHKVERVWLFAWIAFIWTHSLVPGSASSSESGLAVSLLRPLFELVGVTDVADMTFIVRKCAHFTEYAILAALAMRAWVPVRRAENRDAGGHVGSGVIVAMAICLAVPLFDELVIQRLTPGRSGSLRDVAIDLAGCVCGALAVDRVWRPRRSRQGG